MRSPALTKLHYHLRDDIAERLATEEVANPAGTTKAKTLGTTQTASRHSNGHLFIMITHWIDGSVLKLLWSDYKVVRDP